MTTVEEILAAIDKLTLEERAELARRLNGWEDDAWDKQMKADAIADELDALIAEAQQEEKAGKLRDFP